MNVYRIPRRPVDSEKQKLCESQGSMDDGNTNDLRYVQERAPRGNLDATLQAVEDFAQEVQWLKAGLMMFDASAVSRSQHIKKGPADQ